MAASSKTCYGLNESRCHEGFPDLFSGARSFPALLFRDMAWAQWPPVNWYLFDSCTDDSCRDLLPFECGPLGGPQFWLEVREKRWWHCSTTLHSGGNPTVLYCFIPFLGVYFEASHTSTSGVHIQSDVAQHKEKGNHLYPYQLQNDWRTFFSPVQTTRLDSTAERKDKALWESGCQTKVKPPDEEAVSRSSGTCFGRLASHFLGGQWRSNRHGVYNKAQWKWYQKHKAVMHITLNKYKQQMNRSEGSSYSQMLECLNQNSLES